MIVGIVGSKRKKGNTATLVQEALSAAKKEGFETEIIYLGDYDIRGCTGCEGCSQSLKCVIQDDMQEIYEKLDRAEGIITGSPTYFYTMSSDMKAFIERLYCYEVFDDQDRAVWVSTNEALGGKFAATIAICEQESEKDMGSTSEVMDLALTSLGYRIVESVKVLRLFEQGAAQSSEISLKQARRAGEKLAKTIMLRNRVREKAQKK